MGQAADRWKALVEGRLEEMERLREGAGALGAQFWDRRARRVARGPMASADGDPMLTRLRRAVGRKPGVATVLDVGSGPGRFSLAIAPRVARVTAVDPSKRMLQIVRQRAKQAGIANIRTVQGGWQDVDVAPADVVLCAHVLPVVADVVPFLEKLHVSAHKRVLLYVGAFAADGLVDPFWRHFHGQPRRPGAGYVDALAVLQEMGIEPLVEVVEVRARSRYESLDEAVEHYHDMLVLPNTTEVRADLRRLLGPWLQRRAGGFYAPFRTQPAAILSWARR